MALPAVPAVAVILALVICGFARAQSQTTSPTRTSSQSLTRSQTGSRTRSSTSSATQTVTTGLTPTFTPTPSQSPAMTPGPPPCSWARQGCFSDPGPVSFVIPFVVGSVATLEACEAVAALRGFNTAGVRDGGECRAGSNAPYRHVRLAGRKGGRLCLTPPATPTQLQHFRQCSQLPGIGRTGHNTGVHLRPRHPLHHPHLFWDSWRPWQQVRGGETPVLWPVRPTGGKASQGMVPTPHDTHCVAAVMRAPV